MVAAIGGAYASGAKVSRASSTSDGSEPAVTRSSFESAAARGEGPGAFALGTGSLEEPLVLGPKWARRARTSKVPDDVARDEPVSMPPVRLSPVEVHLECSRGPAGARCAARVHVRIEKQDSFPVTGAFYAGAAHVTFLAVDGEPAQAPQPLPPELERYEARGWRAAESPDPLDARLEDPLAFTVRGAGGSVHDVELGLELREREIHRSMPERFLGASALEARHLLLGGPEPRKGTSLVVVTPASAIKPARSLGGLVYDGTTVVDVPREWETETRGDRACPAAATGVLSCPSPDIEERPEDDRTHVTRYAHALGRELVLGVRVMTPPAPTLILPGGPLVGLGAAFGADPGFRARFGWEVGFGASGAVLGSLAAETDVSRRLVLAPLVSVASRAVVLRPSVGVGLGVPIELVPDRRVGARLQLDAHLFAFGVVGQLDVMIENPVHVTGALLFEVSF